MCIQTPKGRQNAMLPSSSCLSRTDIYSAVIKACCSSEVQTWRIPQVLCPPAKGSAPEFNLISVRLNSHRNIFLSSCMFKGKQGPPGSLHSLCCAGTVSGTIKSLQQL